MKAFQCDRCHGFYNKKITVDVELDNKKYKNVNIMRDSDSGWTYAPFDLCPSCLNSLAEWLKIMSSERGW